MSRGMKSHRRDRCTLHKNHLEAFKEWLHLQPSTQTRYWKVLEPTAHSYEVLRAEQLSPSGSYGQSFIYHNNHNDHLTVQADLVPMVRRWLKERKTHVRDA